MNSEPEQYEQLPEAIVARLRARDKGVSQLTPAVDRALAAAAREQFAPRRLRPAAGHRWRYPAAVAAAVALLALFIARPFDSPPADSQRLADDVDGSGQVDILDAFALARARAADPDAVDQRRIDEITDRIVSLSRAEPAL